MDTLIHADIFFLVTTTAVILVGSALTIAILFVIKILNNIRKISNMLRSESGLIAEDVHDIRAKIREGKVTTVGVFHMFRDLFTSSSKSRRKK